MYEQIFASMLEVAINSQFFITGGIFSASAVRRQPLQHHRQRQ